MKTENIIKLTQIATILEGIKSGDTWNGDNDAILCSQKSLNKLGNRIIEIIKDEDMQDKIHDGSMARNDAEYQAEDTALESEMEK